MLRNYLTIAYRNLLRHKVFSLLNISGLAIGMSACLLILQYVSVEMSFDDFHTKGDRIYRVRFDESHNGVVGHSSAGSSPGVGPAMKREFPEVEEIVRLCDMDHWNYIFTYKDLVLSQKNVFMADATFFNMFSYKLISGNPQTALTSPRHMVLSESTAKKYFRGENALGKQMMVYTNQGKGLYTISGVMEDMPANSHLDCKVLLSYSTLVTLDKGAQTSWNWNAFLTYVLLKPGVEKLNVENKFPGLIQTYKGEALAGTNVSWQLSLQALKDIHLFSNLKFEAKPNGNYTSVYLLAGIAVIILIIAWANYINMTTAKAMERAKEVGIRKVIGSHRNQLMLQFLTESFLLNAAALIIALSLVQVLQPLFGQLTGQKMFTLAYSYSFWTGLLLLLMVGSVLSGLYPAFILSSFRPITVLKGNIARTRQGIYLRKSLVIVQFTLSVLLISGTLAIYRQLQYMQQVDLGLNLDQVLVFKSQNVFPKDTDLVQSTRTLKELLQKHSSIQAVTTSSSIPGEAITWATNDFRRAGTAFTQANDFSVMSADHDFARTLDLQLLAGRFFSPTIATNQESVVINEAALQAFGFTSPQQALNEVIISDDFQFKHRIIGVVKNFHQQSLQNRHRPLIFTYQEVWFNNYYEVKLNAADLQETIAYIKTQFERVFPGNPFDYFFLDDFFNQQYQADRQFGKVFSLFSSLAIFVACLGLLGLASFATLQRTKEIGVRKVLGASVSNIVILLSREFIGLILVANLIAWPLAYWGISLWLENYAFHITPSVWLLLLPSVLVCAIALFTVSIQTIKAAQTNPVRSLRYE
ncbi:FtsX-like permease family protein [Rhodocytophaga rosea]|uniref:FtsX-like permease family protein n=1 Tax=Rhodocytophaga rosea TaxID=2704465 RepID=A0A6C0GGB7_9BACT|nr:ABC transporter permease [Rhodocytophaga rosea]QHT67038.1 FtsX-like permease family protein [Rhodocytophaga rosea]